MVSTRKRLHTAIFVFFFFSFWLDRRVHFVCCCLNCGGPKRKLIFPHTHTLATGHAYSVRRDCDETEKKQPNWMSVSYFNILYNHVINPFLSVFLSFSLFRSPSTTIPVVAVVDFSLSTWTYSIAYRTREKKRCLFYIFLKCNSIVVDMSPFRKLPVYAIVKHTNIEEDRKFQTKEQKKELLHGSGHSLSLHNCTWRTFDDVLFDFHRGTATFLFTQKPFGRINVIYIMFYNPFCDL